MKTDPRLILGVLIAFGGAAFGIAERHRSEQANRAVGIVMEAATVQGLASLEPRAVEELRAAGLTAIAVPSVSIADLQQRGAVRLERNGRGEIQVTGDEAARAESALMAYGPQRASLTSSVVLSTVVGLDPELRAMVERWGVPVIARLSNPPQLRSGSLSGLLDDAASAGAVGFLPSGETVLGFRGMVEELATGLQSRRMNYIAPEFAKIAGDARAIEAALGNTIRLHAIQQAELDRMAPAAAADRLTKAVRERHVRYLLVRLPNTAGDDSLAEATGFLRSIRSSIGAAGFTVKPPRPFEGPKIPSAIHGAVGLGLGLVGSWGLRRLGFRGAAGGDVLAAALAGAAYFEPTRPMAAFMVAVIGPVVAQVWAAKEFRSTWPAWLAMGFGLPVLSGLGVAALLAQPSYMMSADVFPGVKAAQAVPVVVALALWVAKFGGWRRWRGLPITWGTATLGLVGLMTVGLMLMRSGNDNPAAVSGIELQFRAILDKVAYVRPRSKEFLLGHPALVFAALMPRVEPGTLLGAAMVVAAIGQGSIVNTFCHLHTPVGLSMARVGIGIALGGILGGLAWAVWLRVGASRAGRAT